MAEAVMANADWQRSMMAWNDTVVDYPSDHCAHQLFEAQVEKAPDAVAVLFEDQALSYEELNRRANHVAHYLQGLGVGPGVTVGLCVERSLEMVVGLLGILKAGGAYLPLDFAYPAERLAFVLNDAAISVLLTQERLLDELPSHWSQIVCLDSDWESISGCSNQNPTSEVKAGDLAYVIYTSGSTGKPKGVMIEHRGLCNLWNAQVRAFGLEASNRVLQFASLSFDASIFEVVMALLTGATLVVARRESLLPGPALIRLLREERITNVTLPPSVLGMLEEVELPELKTIIVAGEACSAELVRRWGKGRRFFNAYGPTETTVWATVAECGVDEGKPSIGRPIDNTRVYVLDENREVAPMGVSGEIYIGGVGLARGYLNREELTAERFIADEISIGEKSGGGRLYRTGDVGRYQGNGEIEYVGRIDHQVKVRGFRIEPGEIEATLGEHPGIRESVVIASGDASDERRLVAYVIGMDGLELSTQELRSFLRERLPDYMVPSAFVMMDTMPLTPNGKVDRKALPAAARARTDGGIGFVAGSTSIEKALCGIWAEVLRLDQVGINDNFFDLGGHSLSLTQVMARMREHLHVELPMQVLFDEPTVAALARRIESDRSGQENEQQLTIAAVPRNGNLPLSFSQERVWFIQQLAPMSRSYHAQATIRFTGDLDMGILERSLSEIVRRHEIFRTTFCENDGIPLQIIHEPWDVQLPVVSLESAIESEREKQAEQLIGVELQRAFNLTELPLVSWKVIRLGPREHLLVQVEHHLIHDGWSFNVLVGEILALYRAFSAGEPSPLAELTFQFADFAVWQRQWMQGAVGQRQLAYWKQKLAGVPEVLELPFDRPRPPMQTYNGASQRIELPSELCASLMAMARQERVTLFMVLMTAFQALLYRYSGQPDLCVGTGIANRRWRQTEGLIGMLINNIVLRAEFSGNPSFRQMLAQTKEVTLEAYEHQDVPFDKVVEALQPKRDLSHNPLFQVMLSFHDAPAPHLELPGVTVELKTGLSNGSAKFDLNLIVMPAYAQEGAERLGAVAEAVTIIWEYNTDLFDDSTISRMVDHYHTLLGAALADLERPISELPLMASAERNRLLVNWNDTEKDYPRICIHELFERQAEKSPETVALVFEGQQLTYRELNQRANQVAHYLRRQGVVPDVRVGILAERSLEMVIGILGILKAGGAYVPLDPEYPRDRLAFMMADANLAMLLTQQRLLDSFPKPILRTLCLDGQWELVAAESDENPVSGVVAENLIYVIYTSGSTGRPKGVLITHGGICNRIAWMQETYRLTEADRVLQKTPFSFDVSVWEFFWPLLTGARLVLARPAGHRDSAYLVKLIEEQQISTLHFVPSMLRVFLEERELGRCSSLKRVICSGEALSSELKNRFYELLPAELHNLYGPTEASVDVTYWACERNGDRTVPIGRPIANTQIHLLDRSLQPVPIGVSGELYISGEGLGRGYINRPELTAEKFVPSGLSKDPGARMYRTGDLARYLPDGSIEFLGRMDDQVKVRGFRIELGEIETVLRQAPGVADAVVVVREDEAGEKRLVAYVVSHKQPAATPGGMGSYLKQRLPEYMAPAAFVLIETVPLTASGKLDRRALPVPDGGRPQLEQGYVAPRTPFEEMAASIYEQVLGIERVGIYDNFFDLGGHSLLAAQIISRLRDQFHVELSLRTFFEFPTVASLVVASSMLERSDQPTGIVGRPSGKDVLAKLDQLSDEEVDSLLGKMLIEASMSAGAAPLQDQPNP